MGQPEHVRVINGTGNLLGGRIFGNRLVGDGPSPLVNFRVPISKGQPAGSSMLAARQLGEDLNSVRSRVEKRIINAIGMLI